MGKLLIILGILLVILGILIHWQIKIPIGNLPGDIVIRRENFTLYIPVTTSILLSIILTIILLLVRKLG